LDLGFWIKAVEENQEYAIFKTMPMKTSNAAGFTLIEVITAVTILALMAAITFSIVFGAVKRSRIIDARSELEIEADGILRLMIEDLRGCWFTDDDNPEIVEDDPFFIGKDSYNRDEPSDGISFLTTAIIPVSPELPSGGIGEVQYSVLESDDGTLSLYRREQIPAEFPHDDGGGVFEITDRLRSLDIGYSDGEDWFVQWDSQGQADHEAGFLPRQIRIELTLAHGEEELTVRSSVAPVMVNGR
jgi:prepilin-type N-terminal cleavage/methylation domain-containing protein